MRRSSRAFQYICVPSLLLCLALAALASNSRNFTGVYNILKVTEQGDNVEVQLSLRVDQSQRGGRHRRHHFA